MLDIQGQPTAAAQPVVQQPTAVQSATIIPSVNGSTDKLVQWTLVVFVFVFVLNGLYLSFVLSQKNSQLDSETKDVSALTQQLGTPDRVKAESTANQLKQAESALQSALATTSPWSGFLKELSSRVPNAVLLTNVSTGDAYLINLSGTASTYGDLAQFITALQASSQFKNVALESAAQGDSQAGSSVTFSIKATFAPATGSTATTSGGANVTQ